MLFTKTRLYNDGSYNFNESIKASSRKMTFDNSLSDSYDIFLSHSYSDREYIYELYKILTKYGYTVYVDWIVDRRIARTNVNKSTAKKIKARMNQCKCLLYAVSDNSSNSKWMPWELGYFDGLKKGMVAIVPIVNKSYDEFNGQEYLGLYPYLDEARFKRTKEKTLWINESDSIYVDFKSWLNGSELIVY